MKEVEFSHKLIINKSGTPFSETEHSGSIELDVSEQSVYLSGDKNGLLALASKLIEVANCDIDCYHKHLDEIELPKVTIKPGNIEFNVVKSNS